MQPSITDWLQGLGTAAGTIFAAIAAFVAIMLFRHETKVRRSDEVDKEAAQARSVFITFEEVTPANSEQGKLTQPRQGDEQVADIEIFIRNLGDAVISDVLGKATRTDNSKVILVVRSDFLAPREKSGHSCTLDPPQLWQLGKDPSELFRFDLLFTDARGFRWRRVNREQPVRVT